jgi:hypothetical protein
MNLPEEIKSSVFQISNEHQFVDLSLKVFDFQFKTNLLFREFALLTGTDPARVKDVFHMPFLPIGFFKDHKVISGDEDCVEKYFSSSGTTGSIPSRHYVTDLKIYEESFLTTFRLFYGDEQKYRFLALLPGYLERNDSSLVYMIDCLVKKTRLNGSGFFLHNLDLLKEKLEESHAMACQTVLFGASYALLDFAERFPMNLEGVIVMETGGMKGRRREMVREELHDILCRNLNVAKIHSEYGMTELLSQAYSTGHGLFRCPPWMKILIRDTNDPLHLLPPGNTGGINIVDLANLGSSAFIATQDLGKLNADGSFEVLGRFDDSDIRGCNLLVV